MNQRYIAGAVSGGDVLTQNAESLEYQFEIGFAHDGEWMKEYEFNFSDGKIKKEYNEMPSWSCCDATV